MNKRVGLSSIYILVGIVVFVVVSIVFYINSHKITLTQTANTTPNSVPSNSSLSSDWSYFVNEKYNYKISFPANWHLSGSDSGNRLDQESVIYITPDPEPSVRLNTWPSNGVLIRVFDNPQKSTAMQIAQYDFPNNSARFTQTKIGDLDVVRADPISVNQSTGNDRIGSSYYLLDGSQDITIPTYITNQSNGVIINRIITSLSLIDSDTTRWKTYTNKDYNFSFKYPSQFTVTEKKEDAASKSMTTTQYVYTFTTGQRVNGLTDSSGFIVSVFPTRNQTIIQEFSGQNGIDGKVGTISITSNSTVDEAALLTHTENADRVFRVGSNFFEVGSFQDANVLADRSDDISSYFGPIFNSFTFSR